MGIQKEEDMSFFDDLGKNIQSKSQAASAMVKEKADTLKINNAISAQKARQKDVMTEIGKAYYEAHKDDEQIDEAFKEFFDQIKSYEDEIANLNEQLAGLKKTTTCPGCGAEVDKGVAFCGKCGTKIEQ